MSFLLLSHPHRLIEHAWTLPSTDEAIAHHELKSR